MSSVSSTPSTSSLVNLTGLVGGNTDWQSLVSTINADQLQAAQAPLNTDLTSQQNILSAWQSFNTTLSAVTNYISTNNLNSSKGYQSYTASTTCADSSITPSNVLTASIGNGTIAAGTYAIEVSDLATPRTDRLRSLFLVEHGPRRLRGHGDKRHDHFRRVYRYAHQHCEQHKQCERGRQRLRARPLRQRVQADPPIDQLRRLYHIAEGRRRIKRVAVAQPHLGK